MSNLMTQNFSKNQVRLDIQRSAFRMKHSKLATANAGDLNVCYFEEVIPGDTFDLNCGSLIRMATPIHPTMSNCYADVHFYFVPNRLVWSHWEEFLGVNKDGYWAQTNNYSVPYIEDSTTPFAVGSLADQFQLPIGKGTIKANALPFRAYGLIWNYYWRDKNLQTPIGVPTDDTNRTNVYTNSYVTDCVLGGPPAKACKLSDVFTRALPSPQKGAAVSLPLGSLAPIRTTNNDYTSTIGLHLQNTQGTIPTGYSQAALGKSSLNTWAGLTAGTGSATGVSPDLNLYPSNLYADLSTATAASINQLRLAFATQRILEAQARAGCSYQELLAGIYNVEAGDARLQMPEYLGGKHFNINMAQVIQTSSTDNTSPQGNTAAYSLTAEKGIHFKKSFVEHGMVIGVYTIRSENLYQQGIPKYFSKRDKYSYYWPQLANISEVAIKNKELYVSGNNTIDEGVFGYQEAWYEYRYHPNEVSGEFRSDYSQSLDSWHYGEDFQSTPVLGSTFIQAESQNVARTLAVQSHAQFLCNFYFDNKVYRPMPLKSIPGLIDHH